MSSLQKLELLAPELLLGIVTRLADLHTLYNLVSASPAASRLFDKYPVTIAEAVISGTQSLVPAEVQELIRAVVLTRISALPIHTLDDFHLRFLRNRKFPHAKSAVPIVLGPGCLPRATSPAMLRGVLATARKVSLLTRACLDFYLARIRADGFTPKHSPGFVRGQAWELELNVEPVAVRDAGPPTWVEEMRVTRALWIVQLTHDLQNAADNGILEAIGWLPEDIQRLRWMRPEDFADLGIPYHGGREELLTVREFLMELAPENVLAWKNRDAPRTQPFGLPRPPVNLTLENRITQKPVEVERTWGNLEYRYGETLEIRPSAEVRKIDKTPRYSEGWRWGQTRSNLNQNAPGVMFHRSLLAHDELWMLTRVKFESFRSLGFGIWDQKRLYLLGLMDGVSPPYHIPSFYSFAWQSLLSADELAELEVASAASDNNSRRPRLRT